MNAEIDRKQEREQWFDDEAFWDLTFPFMFPESRLEAAEVEIESVLNLVDGVVESVLDLCCGPGRHSVALAKKGIKVTGVDRKSSFLKRAAEWSKSEGVSVELLQDDMICFSRPGAFDCILSLFTSFGYFKNPVDNLQVLKNCFKNLRSNGTLVMDLNPDYALETNG